MILTIWRHGQAEERIPDSQRALTESGRDDVGVGCHRLHKACQVRGLSEPDQILYSSWLRTSQTAEIIGAVFSAAKTEAVGALLPASDVTDVDNLLSALIDAEGSDEHVVLVSHQPLVSELVDRYLGDAGAVPFLSPGSFTTLSLDMAIAGCASLLFCAFPSEYEVGV